MMEDPAPGEHPGRRDEDERPRAADDRLRRLDAGGARLSGVDERGVARLEEGERLGVVALRVAEVDVVRLAGHGRVDEQWQVRNLALPDQVVQEPDEVLGPTDGEGRDEEHAAVARHVGDDRDQLAHGLVRIGVLAVAIGRLHDDHVRRGQRCRVPEDRRVRPAEVAGEHDRQLRPALVADSELDDRRAEDVTRVVERSPRRRR